MSYFDGANQADSTQYDLLALAAVSGTKQQWQPFEKQWKKTLRDNHADFLHMTDALSLQGHFYGWTNTKVAKLIKDCVKVSIPHLARQRRADYPGKIGLFAYAIVIDLKDFARARKNNPDVPRNANELCATQAAFQCQRWGAEILGTVHYHFFFDQGEPFRGHIVDRIKSPKATKDIPMLKNITLNEEANMRFVSALQLADLVGWSVSHRNNPAIHKWQRDLLKTIFVEIADYEQLIRPVPTTVEFAKNWKLPKRKQHP